MKKLIRKNSFPRPWLAGMLAGALLLASCGGGGGGGDSRSALQQAQQPADGFAASSTLANVCSIDGQKTFTRSYLNEAYLWYDEIVDVSAAQYRDAVSYFDSLLVRAPDVNGLPKDRYSAMVDASTAQWQLSLKYGRPQQTQAGSTAVAPANSPVPITKVVTSPSGRKAGYILFLDHDQGAQDALIDSFKQLRDQQVQDLVLDLRYNSGGYLYIALAAASMVTGATNQGKVFEQLHYNKKRATETANSFLLFSSQLQFGEATYPRGTLLPQLNLPRLYVLTSKSTCSASESIINSLRGIDVQVILVGQTTCGKPYGFSRHDNCQYAYFPIEFQGFNAKGYGDYTAGFRPTCNVSGNTTSAMGDPSEPLLSAALMHMDTGACPAGTGTPLGVELSVDPSIDRSAAVRPPWAGRLLAPQR